MSLISMGVSLQPHFCEKSIPKSVIPKRLGIRHAWPLGTGKVSEGKLILRHLWSRTHTTALSDPYKKRNAIAST